MARLHLEHPASNPTPTRALKPQNKALFLFLQPCPCPRSCQAGVHPAMVARMLGRDGELSGVQSCMFKAERLACTLLNIQRWVTQRQYPQVPQHHELCLNAGAEPQTGLGSPCGGAGDIPALQWHLPVLLYGDQSAADVSFPPHDFLNTN